MKNSLKERDEERKRIEIIKPKVKEKKNQPLIIN
jgi:hypothetical protein